MNLLLKLLTDRQTDRQTDKQTNANCHIPSLAEAIVKGLVDVRGAIHTYTYIHI